MGERCKLPSGRNRFLCILALKSDICMVATILSIFLRIKLTTVYVLRTDLNNSEIRYTKITYFPERGCVKGCVHTLLNLYVYATGIADRCVLGGELLAERCRTDDLLPSIPISCLNPCRMDPKVLGLNILINCSQPGGSWSSSGSPPICWWS